MDKTEQRTPTQNDAMHLWFEQVAESLNSAGYDVRAVMELFKDGIDVPFTKENFKETLWKPFQKALVKKKSTTELDKSKEITLIHKVLMDSLMRETGIEYIPFPSLESLINQKI